MNVHKQQLQLLELYRAMVIGRFTREARRSFPYVENLILT